MGAGISRAKRDREVRPYTLRVVRDHGGGLWTFEANDGQLYLAVLSAENTARRRLIEANRDVPQQYADDIPRAS